MRTHTLSQEWQTERLHLEEQLSAIPYSQPSMCYAINSQNTDNKFPFLKHLCAFRSRPGRVDAKVVVLHEITDARFAEHNNFPNWLEYQAGIRGFDMRINGKRIAAERDAVLVFYAKNDGEPKLVRLPHKAIPFDGPYPDYQELWDVSCKDALVE